MSTGTELAQLRTREICMRNIAVATDFSPVSEKAFGYAAAVARSYGAKLHIVHAIPTESSLLPTLVEHDQLQHESEEKMEQLSRRRVLSELAHEQMVRPGTVWGVVSDVIQRQNIDLLVVGTHGRGGLKKIMLGSEAEELMRLSACAVLTVAPNAPDPGSVGCEFRRILFATGFGPASEKALDYALFFAKPAGAQLILLHVLPPTPFPSARVGPRAHARVEEWRDEEAATITEQLRRLLPADAALESRTEYVARFDLLFPGILAAAADYRPDLIVMGAKRSLSSKAMAHVPWTVAHEVLCHAPCPVLTVRA